MAATKSLAHGEVPAVAVGQLRAVPFDVVLATNDYLTGGISFSEMLPFSELLGASVIAQTAVGYVPAVIVANKKLMLFEQDAGGALAEVGNGSSTAVTIRLLAFGIGL